MAQVLIPKFRKNNYLRNFLIGVVLTFLSGILIGSFCWTYSLNTWLEFAHKTMVIHWWQGALIGFVPGIGHLGLVIAVVTWISMMFLK